MRPSHAAKTGRIWVYEKGKPPRLGSAATECRENGYLGVPRLDGPPDEWLEGALSREESAHAGLLPLVPNRCFVWDYGRRVLMAECVGLMFARSRGRQSGQGPLLETGRALMRELAGDGFFDQLAADLAAGGGPAIAGVELAARFDAEAGSNSGLVRQTAFAEGLIAGAQQTAAAVSRRHWQVWHAPTGTEFVTSDTPVATALPVGDRLSPGFGFNDDRTLLFFPLAPASCLVAGMAGSEHREVGAGDVWEINRLLVAFAQRFVYGRSRSEAVRAMVEERCGAVRFGATAFVPTPAQRERLRAGVAARIRESLLPRR